MKLAVLSESSADEAALRILVEGLLGRPTEPVALPALRTRGWPSVLHVLPSVIKALYYQTDADALVVVVDSDLTPVHLPDHDTKPPPKCRFCQLRPVAQGALGQLRPRPDRGRLQIFLGLAVPSLEAWFRVGRDPHVTEAAWLQALQSRKFPYDVRRLKLAVYGTERPSLGLEARRMVEEATRLVPLLADVETWFPNGFGPLAQAVRGGG